MYPTARAKTAQRTPPKAQTLHDPTPKKTPPAPPPTSAKPGVSFPKAPRALSPENMKDKWHQLEAKFRSEPQGDPQMPEDLRERKNRFIARMDFLKFKKGNRGFFLYFGARMLLV